MIIERDEGSDGWIAYEGRWNPENYEFDRLRACFKCPERGALDNGSYQEWYVNAAPIGAALTGGLRPCVAFPSGNVNDTCYFCWVWLQMFPP